MSGQPELREALPSTATVARPAAPTVPPARPRALASLRSLRNWKQLAKFCAVGAVGSSSYSNGVYTLSNIFTGLYHVTVTAPPARARVAVG